MQTFVAVTTKIDAIMGDIQAFRSSFDPIADSSTLGRSHR
jgi:hypothetical protein